MYYLKSKRDKWLLIYENYIHNLRNANKNTKTYTCKDRNCPGKVVTTLEGVFVSSNQHNHENSIEEVNKLILNNKIKDLAAESTYRSREIYTKLIISEGNQNKYNRKTVYKNISNVRKAIKNENITDNDFPLHLMYTYKKEKFLMVDSDNFKIFSTRNNLNILKRSQKWMADGTFSSSPIGYEQLYVIYGSVFQKVIPLFYIIMKNKTELLYREVFYVNKIFGRFFSRLNINQL